MSIAKAVVTPAQLDQALQAATNGYMRLYGQVHDTPAGKLCWAGRLERAYLMASQETDELNKKRMDNAIKKMISLAEVDFINGERAHADYVDLCASARVEPQVIEPNCQCEYCQRVPRGAELLFAAEAA